MNRKRVINTYYFFWGATALFLASLTLSVYLMSVSQFLMAFFWLLDGVKTEHLSAITGDHVIGIRRFFQYFLNFCHELLRNFIEKVRVFLHNKPALIFTGIFLLHIAGLAFTSDFTYAIKDLRTKLPLLILPLFFSTFQQVKEHHFRCLLLIYIGAVLANTFISTWVYFSQVVTNTRDISLFISHIRFGLNICLAIFILFFLIREQNYFSRNIRIAFGVVILWLLIFIFIAELLTAIIILLAVLLLLAMYSILRLRKLHNRILAGLVLVAIPTALLLYVDNIVKDYRHASPVSYDTLETHTVLGNRYRHDTLHLGVENGRYISLYLCEPELKEAWSQRSMIPYDSLDLSGQEINYTLIRYLTSKDLRKDADGLAMLTNTEIKLIESGIANAEYLKQLSFKTRVYQAYMGYERYLGSGNPNANSLTQRIEYWKVSIHIIKKNLWTGVGTGDLNLAFTKAYEEMNSPLEKRFQHRSHNQYLSIAVAFGVPGLLIFLAALLIPPFIIYRYKNHLFNIFIVIALLSMLSEDTIETQAGVSFIALFYCLFLWGQKQLEAK